MNRKLRKLLYRSFDLPLNRRERASLEKAFSQSNELVEESRQIDLLRRQLALTKTAEFTPFFVERVAARVVEMHRQQQLFYTAFFQTFRRVMAFTAVSLLIFIACHYYQVRQWPAVLNVDDMVSMVFTPALEDIL
ncbi:hypothetical protein GX408_20275 [bacterium]|nr:hypothetical protein [bacterium]